MIHELDRQSLDIAKYEMDTFGFCRIPNLISPSELNEISLTLDKIASLNCNLPGTDVCLGQKRDDGTMFISNIADASSLLRHIPFNPVVLQLLSLFMQSSFKFNHSNAIISTAGFTYPHMAGSPIHPKAFYHYTGSSILSSLTKLVVPITHNEYLDGGFAAVKGSHKANYPIPFESRSSQEASLLEHIPISYGDAILFTEAMTHGSLPNISGNRRRMIFFCYSLNYMPNWSTQGLMISNSFKAKLSSDLYKYL